MDSQIGFYNMDDTFIITLLLLLPLYGAPAVETDSVSVFVMERDSVTLHISLTTNQQDRMIWLFKGNRIAQINGDQSKICTDYQCKEMFKDRLNVNRNGSLTITNIRNADSGHYDVKITSRNIADIFIVTVHDVPTAQPGEVKRKSVKEGESVTLDPGVIKNPNDSIMWYFNNTYIAEITGGQCKICEDEPCKERFRDRLKLDHQNGSLTITNTRTTDSGDYKLKNSSSRFTIIRNFTVTVTSSGSLSAAAAAAVGVVVFLLLLAAAVFYLRRQHRHQQQNMCRSEAERQRLSVQPSDQGNGAEVSSSNQACAQVEITPNGTDHNGTEAMIDNRSIPNGTSHETEAANEISL